ncbi:arsenic resistance protein [Paenibacillus sp. 7541]|uniref:arsenic resistance protein n=1 Tax=Paenibacillus sp. 7541 TaxID=2026236 RepID=UPI000BA548AA|nr:arsenic resistance protein [Paenibacillus sp. 7541]PAK55521.1 arsenic resistance protein [Paenibacillus sp. 7541]
MSTMDKLQTLIIIAAVGIGLAIGQIPAALYYAEMIILPSLLLMMYGLFLTIPLRQLRQAFANLRFLSASAVINYMWTPLLAWGLGAIFLSEHPALWIGFMMLMVTPCTDWYLVFTSIARGNVPLSASILPMNLMLQLLLLPVYLLVFSGTVGTFDLSSLAESVLLVLALPFGLALLTRALLRRRPAWLERGITPFFAKAQLWFLSLAIAAMFASQGSQLFAHMETVYILLVPVLLFFSINYIVGGLASRLLGFSYEDSASLRLTILARNSPVALAIAVTAFPDEPLVALALVVGPLIELPVLALITQLLLSGTRRRPVSGRSSIDR